MHVTSRKGRAFVWNFELAVLTTYDDGVGILTIGVGHTAAAGPPKPVSGMKITLEEAAQLFAKDLRKYEDAVRENITRDMAQHEFDAFVSLCFNIGPAGFARSSVARHFNAGRKESAGGAFRLWNKGGGRVLPGLVRRREAEREIMLRNNYGDVSTVPVQDRLGAPIRRVPMPK